MCRLKRRSPTERSWSQSMNPFDNMRIIPGQLLACDGEIGLNEGAETRTLHVANTGDRPIQVGSHYHFAETNIALKFDRGQARGFRLDIPAGSAVRFEPGQIRE